MEEELIDDFRNGMPDKELQSIWFKIVIVVLLASIVHFVMVLYKDLIPEPFMEGEPKFSIRGMLVFVVMLFQNLILEYCKELL